MGDLLRRTTSLAGEERREVPAQVVEEGGAVYLVKPGADGEPRRILLERDAGFYRAATAEQRDAQVFPHLIHLYISSRCNLSCPVCYEAGEDPEPSLQEIQATLRGLRGRFITLMGREPTCREDLPRIIRLAARRNNVSLLTNGVKLADADYTRELSRCGLQTVTLSVNGLSDDVYRRMNGAPLLETKLRALDNLRACGIKTIVSMTLARGINEDQLRPMAELCLDRLDHVHQLRVRSLSPVGKHLEVNQYCMSEMVELLTGALGIPARDAHAEQRARWAVTSKLGPLAPRFLRDYLTPRLCTLSFHVRRRGDGVAAVVNGPALDGDESQTLLSLALSLARSYGPGLLLDNLALLLRLPPRRRARELMIMLKCWPNLDTLDLEENRKCPSLYMRTADGQAEPFCLANIRHAVVGEEEQP